MTVGDRRRRPAGRRHERRGLAADRDRDARARRGDRPLAGDDVGPAVGDPGRGGAPPRTIRPWKARSSVSNASSIESKVTRRRVSRPPGRDDAGCVGSWSRYGDGKVSSTDPPNGGTGRPRGRPGSRRRKCQPIDTRAPSASRPSSARATAATRRPARCRPGRSRRGRRRPPGSTDELVDDAAEQDAAVEAAERSAAAGPMAAADERVASPRAAAARDRVGTSFGGGRRWAKASCESLVGWRTVTSIARSGPRPDRRVRRELGPPRHGRVEELHVAEQEARARSVDRGQARPPRRPGEREGLLARGPAARARGRPARRPRVRAGGQDQRAPSSRAPSSERPRPCRIGATRRDPIPLADRPQQRRARGRTIAAISKASRSRARSGRWTAWATAPSPATPRRSAVAPAGRRVAGRSSARSIWRGLTGTVGCRP